MQWILNILIQKRNLLLFLFLLGIGIIFSSYRSSYHQTKIQRFGIIISGGVFKSINNSKSYLSLTESNQSLLAENKGCHFIKNDKYLAQKRAKQETRKNSISYRSNMARLARIQTFNGLVPKYKPLYINFEIETWSLV